MMMRDAHSSSQLGFSRAYKHSQVACPGMRLVHNSASPSSPTAPVDFTSVGPESPVGGRGRCRRRGMPSLTAGPPCGAPGLMYTSPPPSSCQGGCPPRALPCIPAVADGEDSPEVSASCDDCNGRKGAAEGVTLGQREGSSRPSGPHPLTPKGRSPAARAPSSSCRVEVGSGRSAVVVAPAAGGVLPRACVGRVPQQVLLAVVHTTAGGAGLKGSTVIHPPSSLHSGCCCWRWQRTNNRVAVCCSCGHRPT